MKLGEGGEAFFVFETNSNVPEALITSPIVSPTGSPLESPDYEGSIDNSNGLALQEPEFLDLTRSRSRTMSPDRDAFHKSTGLSTSRQFLDEEDPESLSSDDYAKSLPGSLQSSSPIMRNESPTREQTIERIRQLTRKLTDINIPSTISDNGDIILDMTGYKSGDEYIKEYEDLVKRILAEELGTTSDIDLESMVGLDQEGNLRIYSREDGYTSDDNQVIRRPISNSLSEGSMSEEAGTHYVKTLRLTSDQLKSLELKPGANEVSFKVNQGKAICNAYMFYWTSKSPIVISDIDGTITKSDALGHVLTMLGRDWTHQGVAKLFTDINNNGYNVMYLTARSVGQADSTRSYLHGIEQDGFKVPQGPVILSPDRTIAALRREVIMKKPEVFKMACLRDIQSLFGKKEDGETRFFAGFGNRITDALSYRSVGVPSSRIFTINSNSEVHMELLELAGYKSSYVHIADLVDHFFPPVLESTGGDERFTDVNFWREPLPELSDDDNEDYEVREPSHEKVARVSEDSLLSEDATETGFDDNDDDNEELDEEDEEDEEDEDYQEEEEEEEEEDYDDEDLDEDEEFDGEDIDDNDDFDGEEEIDQINDFDDHVDINGGQLQNKSEEGKHTEKFDASFQKASDMIESMKLSE